MITHLVLDTSIFVNPAAANQFGPSPTAAMQHFLELAHSCTDVQFLMPPSVYEELMHFVEESKLNPDLLLLIQRQPPKKNEVKIPGIFLYSLVDEIRDRFDRGLRLAERHVREALEIQPLPKESRHNFKGPRPDAEAIGRLRESYRRIMREGMLDSKADVDLILLAYELGGTLVSADQGVLQWAENFGIQLLKYEQLISFLSTNKKEIFK